jgi:hypothetical protein
VLIVKILLQHKLLSLVVLLILMRCCWLICMVPNRWLICLSPRRQESAVHLSLLVMPSLSSCKSVHGYSPSLKYDLLYINVAHLAQNILYTILATHGQSHEPATTHKFINSLITRSTAGWWLTEPRIYCLWDYAFIFMERGLNDPTKGAELFPTHAPRHTPAVNPMRILLRYYTDVAQLFSCRWTT